LTATATEDLGGGDFGSTSEFSAATPSPDLVIVNSTGDAADAVSGDGQCDTGGTNADGDPECTLRSAIGEANDATTPVDTIWFAIPATDAGHSAGVWTITPGAPLPAATAADALTIDASTQSGWVANTVASAPSGAVGFDGTQAIVLDGSSAGVGVSGLVLDGDGSAVRGLVVGGFTNHGIELNGDDGSVTAVYAGTDATGTTANGNGGDGIHVTGANAAIGGSGPADRVLVAGNGDDGIGLAGAGASGATVLGSIGGADVTGSAALANSANGVNVDGASGVRIGGAAAGDGNVIAGNGADGVLVAGVTAEATVLGNRTSGNGRLAIDLAGGSEDGNGVTANDGGDGDAGPNDLLNRPVLADAVTAGGIVDVDVAVDLPAGTYRLEVFTNPDGADPSGAGETGLLAATASIVHGGAGTETIAIGLAGGPGTVVTATVTEDLGGGNYGITSEASNAVTAVAIADLRVGESSIRRSDPRAGGGLDPGVAVGTGVAGDAITFDGTDDRLAGPDLDVVDGALTFGAWVRADALTGLDRVLSKRDTAANPIYELSVDGGTGEAVATIRLGGPVTVRGGSVATGAWHQLLATWDGADLALYVDGTEVDRTAATGTLALDVDTAAVIGNTDAGGAGFDGRIDHVVVDHRAYAAERVAADHTAATDGANLVSIGGQQTGAPGPWTVSADQARSGGFSLSAPETAAGGGAAWAVATGIDEVGSSFRSWWWVSSATGVDLAGGTRAGAVPTDQFEVALTSPAGWELRRRSGPTVATDAVAAGAPSTGTWVEVEIQTDQDGNSRILIDGVEVTGWTAQGGDPASGSIGLRTGLLPTGQRWYVDDPTARKLITPEPVTSLGPLDRQ
ncbi:MAG: LamG-like jellyroll fold domain-containing protein, partial [Actinomycetota bacterium]